MESTEAYRAMVAASDEQRRRRQPPAAPANRWDSAAARFREDPRRTPDDNLQAIASFIRPDDVVLDVGGGAGRYSLPLAFLCREVINIEPSPGMGSEFEASAKEAAIENARLVKTDWIGAQEISGDVSLVSHVTYFVADIVPFIEKLIAASRRRVILGVSSTPPPNQGADLFEVLNGEPQALVPGHRELLPVLWERGILPEIRVVGAGQSTLAGRVYATRDEALESQLGEREGAERDLGKAALERVFDRLFREAPGGFRRNMGDARFMLITWEKR